MLSMLPTCQLCCHHALTTLHQYINYVTIATMLTTCCQYVLNYVTNTSAMLSTYYQLYCRHVTDYIVNMSSTILPICHDLYCQNVINYITMPWTMLSICHELRCLYVVNYVANISSIILPACRQWLFGNSAALIIINIVTFIDSLVAVRCQLR